MNALPALSRNLRLGSRVLLLALLAVWPLLAHAQTNPCTDTSTATSTVVNPTKAYATLTDHTATVLGDATQPLVIGYTMQFFLEGAAQPVTTTDIAKAAWTLVSGTPDCYTATISAAPLAVNTRHVAKLVARGPAGIGDSQPSEASNPFGRVAAPRPVGALRMVR